MPDRLAIPLQDIADWHWLARCTRLAARGKRSRESVQRYLNQFERSTSQVAAALRNGCLPYGSYRPFSINDPKPRVIHAAPFADRVAHHALIGRMADRFERSQVESSYACRPGKGCHASIIAAQKIAARSPYLLKMDVHSYFAFVDHEILLSLLQRLFKGQGLFKLLNNVLASFHTLPGRGLPIGALTSQYFANYYLDEFQRALRRQHGVIDELRYMDDHWVGCASKQAARDTVSFTNEWLQQHRKLSVKPVQIQRSAIGLPFCGFRVSSKGLRMGRRRIRAIKKHYQQIGRDYSAGVIGESKAKHRLTSVTSLASPGSHSSVMNHIIATSGINNVCC
ncbi:hypothetical protein AB833_03110 [Chromatiales bacterium (ex Bugula neritina AB1)]|nr:hypothetical protein AB833_03110 [Chromatiales bacterium (ex Bugula neritina AB1)]